MVEAVVNQRCVGCGDHEYDIVKSLKGRRSA